MTPEQEKVFGFEPLTEREILDQKGKDELKKAYRAVAESAAGCLSSDMFQKYLKDYENFRDKAAIACNKIPTANINEYAFIVHEIISKLDAMRYLKELVEKDIRKGHDEEV